MDLNKLVNYIVVFYTVLAAVAAWRAVNASKVSAETSRNALDFNYKNYLKEKMKSSHLHLCGEAILRLKDVLAYIGHVEVDKYGNVICSNMHKYINNVFPGEDMDHNLILYVRDDFVDKYGNQGLGNTWVTKDFDEPSTF